MTKEFEERKHERKPGILFRVFKIVITIGVFIMAMLFLLMVAFPKGLWVDIF